MDSSPEHQVPVLVRAGDIGVSSEWRDLTFDWWPILTADGVFLYSYLRDTFEHQRALRPFLLSPEGPSKKRMQRVLQRRTHFGVQGPEYILDVVGLVHVAIRRGSSFDPARPHSTAAASYTIGALEQPRLAWPVIERVLNALMLGLAPERTGTDDTPNRQAQAAIRSLAQSGMLANDDPCDIYDPDGAWVVLLPHLIRDERWVALFAYVHGAEAVEAYRAQARAWVEWANERAERLRHDNARLREYLLAAAQRRTVPASQLLATGTPATLSHAGPSLSDAPDLDDRVPGRNPTSPSGHSVNDGPPGTPHDSPHTAAPQGDMGHVPPESQAADLIKRERSGNQTTINRQGTQSMSSAFADSGSTLPRVAPHVREAELYTTRIDATFWRSVRRIIQDDIGAVYDYRAGERKAVQRVLERNSAPVGVVLAALRAMLTLPDLPRPQRLVDVFHHAAWDRTLESACAAVPAAGPQVPVSGSWEEFIQGFRSVGASGGLRNIGFAELPLIAELFRRVPEACWEVLHRAQRAARPPSLSYDYLRAAIRRNQREAVAEALHAPTDNRGRQLACPGGQVGPDAAAEDPRRILLLREGLSLALLTEMMPLAYITAWIAYVDRHQQRIHNRRAYLTSVLVAGNWPDEPTKADGGRGKIQLAIGSRRDPATAGIAQVGDPHSVRAPTEDSELASIWTFAVARLGDLLSAIDIDTWVAGTTLVELSEDVAVVGVPNVFAREALETRLLEAIRSALAVVLGRDVVVQVVIR